RGRFVLLRGGQPPAHRPGVPRDRSRRAGRHREIFRARRDRGRHDARRPRGAPARRAPLRRGDCGPKRHRDSRRALQPDREAMYDVIVEFPKMKVAVKTRDERVVEICYLPPSVKSVAPRTALAKRVAEQLERYRENADTKFDLPLVVEGTPLQRAVWEAMCAIPRGKTRTYGELARELGAGARDIGQACGDNRLPIVIPCHRVVAADGLGGFGHATGGYLLEVKRWL